MPVFGIGEREEGVAHRCRAEPFVTGERVGLTRPFAAIGTARVVLARTSEPPCFSVIAIPIVTPDFSSAGRDDGS